MKRPNFFIIGAPKCGTTALSEYLRDHPRVFVSWPKEPHYFAEDFARYRRIRSRDRYLDLFHDAGDEHLAVGEASVWYLYSSVAVENIRSFNPQAKIIVMLRNPVEFLPSIHSQLVFNFFETEDSLLAAWRQQPARLAGKNIPPSCPEPLFLQYRRLAQFGAQLESVLGVFPRRQVKVILLEEFSRSPRSVYEEVLGFLGVPSDGRRHFPRINTRKRHRSAVLGRLFMNPPRFVRVVERWVKRGLRAVGVRNYRAWRRLIYANTKPTEKKQVPDQLRTEVVRALEPDVERLSELIDRDLTHWLSAGRSRPKNAVDCSVD